jgi:hypothetical protein
LAKTREHGAAFKIAPAKEAPATDRGFHFGDG